MVVTEKPHPPPCHTPYALIEVGCDIAALNDMIDGTSWHEQVGDRLDKLVVSGRARCQHQRTGSMASVRRLNHANTIGVRRPSTFTTTCHLPSTVRVGSRSQGVIWLIVWSRSTWMVKPLARALTQKLMSSLVNRV